ncbi:hypothetical protein D9M73_288210 [compost metagenome]
MPKRCVIPRRPRGMANDMASWLMSQINPLSSRATATTAMLGFLPRAASLR